MLSATVSSGAFFSLQTTIWHLDHRFLPTTASTMPVNVSDACCLNEPPVHGLNSGLLAPVFDFNNCS